VQRFKGHRVKDQRIEMRWGDRNSGGASDWIQPIQSERGAIWVISSSPKGEKEKRWRRPTNQKQRGKKKKGKGKKKKKEIEIGIGIETYHKKGLGLDLERWESYMYVSCVGW
jgi:hypothetical protein